MRSGTVPAEGLLPLTMGIAALLLTFKILQAGSYAKQDMSSPAMIVAQDANTLRNLWNSGQPPVIDFKKQTVVFLYAGEKTTGGFSIKVKSVKKHGKETLIDAPIEGPPAGGMVTQAITHPFTVIAIPKSTRVKWLQVSK